MKLRMSLTALAAVLLAAAGCHNSVNSVENAEKAAVPAAVADRRVVTDGFLRDRLKITDVAAAETEGGMLRVQVTAVNDRTGLFGSGDAYAVDYKFTWFDHDGIQVDSSVTTWQTRRVKPGETIHFRSSAPSPRCRDFRLELKETN